MSVHDESVPGSTQHSAQLGDGKSIGVLTDWWEGSKRRRRKQQESGLDGDDEKRESL